MSAQSRHLPDRPNLRYLRIEAKRRLAAGEFNTLHEARLAIAREHGLSSWTALKELIEASGPTSHALAQVLWVVSCAGAAASGDVRRGPRDQPAARAQPARRRHDHGALDGPARRSVRDPATGRHINTDLAGHHIAAHADVPDIEADYEPGNPAGSKAWAKSAPWAPPPRSRTPSGTPPAAAGEPCPSASTAYSKKGTGS